MPLVLSCPLACGVRAWPWYEHRDQPARQADLTVGRLETVPPHAQQGIDINRFWDALGCNRWQVFRQPGRAASATSGTARIPRRQSWAVRAGAFVLLCAARSRRKGDFVGLPQVLSLQAPCLRPALQLGTQEGPCARLRYAHLSLSFGGTLQCGYLALGLYQVCDRAGLPGVQSEPSNTLSQASPFFKFWCTGHWYTRESWCAFGTSLLEKL